MGSNPGSGTQRAVGLDVNRFPEPLVIPAPMVAADTKGPGSRLKSDRLLGERYGPASLASLSFDKGFTREQDRQLLALYLPEVILPKRGKRNAAEAERERARRFVELRHQHHAIESDIHCLEHQGLNRCLDKGLPGFRRYVGFGVLAYNLHKIGARLLASQALNVEQKLAA